MFAMFLAVVGSAYMEHLFKESHQKQKFQTDVKGNLMDIEYKVRKITSICDEVHANAASLKENNNATDNDSD